MKVLGILASAAASRRTRGLGEVVLAALRQIDPSIQTDVLDQAAVPVAIGDRRRLGEYDPAWRDAAAPVSSSDALIVGTPVYRASHTGVLKSLFALLPDDHLAGRSAGLLATGGGDRHDLAWR